MRAIKNLIIQGWNAIFRRNNSTIEPNPAARQTQPRVANTIPPQRVSAYQPETDTLPPPPQKKVQQKRKNMGRIILIAGHHGAGTGVNSFLDEGAENIRVRDDLTQKLIDLGVPKNEIITDKGRDNLVLRDIVAWLRNDIIRINDICIDIHFNAATPAATGTETFVPNHPTANEILLARDVNNAMVSSLGLRDRGVKWERESHVGSLAMLSFDCTTILLEICFVTNENDAKAYRNNYNSLIDNLGKAIINHYFEL